MGCHTIIKSNWEMSEEQELIVWERSVAEIVELMKERQLLKETLMWDILWKQGLASLKRGIYGWGNQGD